MMPEGPEVKTLVHQLQGGVGLRLIDTKFISGRYVRVGKPAGFTAFAATMTQWKGEDPFVTTVDTEVDRIRAIKAKGKFIYFLLDDGIKAQNNMTSETSTNDFQRSIWVTLGMTGKFVNEKVNAENDRQCRWYMELLDISEGTTSRVYFHDIRNFGTLKFCLSREALEEKLRSLGPDILEPSTSEEIFLEIMAAQKQDLNVCKFLMNQKKICGIGNYILAEGLYRADIDPFASLGEFSEEQKRRLFLELRNTALESYDAQGMTRKYGGTYTTVDGTRGNFEFQLKCYGRRFCERGRPVIREVNGPHGRTIWYTREQLFMPLNIRMSRPIAASAENKRVEQAKEKTMTLDSVNEKSNLAGGILDVGWNRVLAETLDSPAFRELDAFLKQEQAQGQIVYPPKEEIFTALNSCPFDQVKVVIVGQDPYHGPGQGHGLAFSVREGVPLPPSLRNIFKEASEDVGIPFPLHGNLDGWAKQGVLLLNSVLSVRKGNANSHAGHGWEAFTDAVIREVNNKNTGVVFLLWGNPAAKKAGKINEEIHYVIRTSHPSPLGATRTKSPFLGSRCFSQTNRLLEEMGQKPIDWSVN